MRRRFAGSTVALLTVAVLTTSCADRPPMVGDSDLGGTDCDVLVQRLRQHAIDYVRYANGRPVEEVFGLWHFRDAELLEQLRADLGEGVQRGRRLECRWATVPPGQDPLFDGHVGVLVEAAESTAGRLLAAQLPIQIPPRRPNVAVLRDGLQEVAGAQEAYRRRFGLYAKDLEEIRHRLSARTLRPLDAERLDITIERATPESYCASVTAENLPTIYLRGPRQESLSSTRCG